MQETRGAAPLLCSIALALVLARAAPARAAAEPAAAPHPVSYREDVAPIFDRWCISCHGAHEVQGGLRLDSFQDVLRGGDAGPAVIAGDPAGSLLVAKIERRHHPSMPPRRRLPAAAITRIRAWIAAGTSP